MYPVGQPFPATHLPSSKGGTVNLQEMFVLGSTVVGVIPHADREQWIESASLQVDYWLLEEYVNVYFIIDASKEEAQRLCERYGILDPFLLDDEGRLYPDGEGFYRIDAEGVIEAAVGHDDGPHHLERLF